MPTEEELENRIETLEEEAKQLRRAVEIDGKRIDDLQDMEFSSKAGIRRINALFTELEMTSAQQYSHLRNQIAVLSDRVNHFSKSISNLNAMVGRLESITENTNTLLTNLHVLLLELKAEQDKKKSE